MSTTKTNALARREELFSQMARVEARGDDASAIMTRAKTELHATRT